MNTGEGSVHRQGGCPKCPEVRVIVEGLEARCLLDSGADISCIPEKSTNVILEKNPSITRQVQLSIEGISTVRMAHFFVVKGLIKSVTLGMDFLFDNKVTLDFSRQQLVFGERARELEDGVLETVWTYNPDAYTIRISEGKKGKSCGTPNIDKEHMEAMDELLAFTKEKYELELNLQKYRFLNQATRLIIDTIKMRNLIFEMLLCLTDMKQKNISYLLNLDVPKESLPVSLPHHEEMVELVKMVRTTKNLQLKKKHDDFDKKLEGIIERMENFMEHCDEVYEILKDRCLLWNKFHAIDNVGITEFKDNIEMSGRKM
uniref:Uncharacterized protein n=1 Tax=Timema tahoe TaxID=61484 RepID=A0A7R9FNC6_9NEOP|nr:unnamed protein product [Timema tahoe]